MPDRLGLAVPLFGPPWPTSTWTCPALGPKTPRLQCRFSYFVGVWTTTSQQHVKFRYWIRKHSSRAPHPPLQLVLFSRESDKESNWHIAAQFAFAHDDDQGPPILQHKRRVTASQTQSPLFAARRHAFYTPPAFFSKRHPRQPQTGTKPCLAHKAKRESAGSNSVSSGIRFKASS
jgi:hypothetical protein